MNPPAETSDRVHKALPDLLQPEQAKRLQQIELQVNGFLSLNKPDVQTQLNLTEKQRDEIKEINDGFKQDLAEAVKDAAASAPEKLLEKARQAVETARKIKTLADAATKKAFGTLTDEQRKTWKEMTGEKFELKLELLNRPSKR